MGGAGGAPIPLGLCESPPALLMSRAGSCTLDDALWHKTLSEAQLLEVALRLCRRVKEIHAKGVVHNDLKTNNIMLSADLDVHIIDFGLASPEHALTKRDIQDCFPDWLAPEVLLGGGRNTFASDVYSVGHVLSEIHNEMGSPGDPRRGEGKFLEAIRSAMRRAPEERPTMRELISLMEALKAESEIP
ncbi:mitogen-activated protein kinase 12-like [Penaeus monodon]|uniref:mitogen-activated protein kinase 12-like n=1 Tax=Penaeus monodon TaxID=6687 RepID=UPI0018A767E8|nr:mitogen-activated protein kinase 12-like [Penaeus monodon]